MSIIQAPSLADVLAQRAQMQPDSLSHVFIDNVDGYQHRLTYGDIDRRARAIAARLQAINARRVLLIYPHGPSFFLAFMACWYSGATPIPVFPPQSRRGMARVEAILRDCSATHVLSSSDLMAKVQPWFHEAKTGAGLQWLDTDSVPDSEAADWRHHSIDPQQPAFFQYTSGSTGNPKGVVVSHANLMANEAMITQGFSHNKESRSFSWLPFYHDMGLIGPLFNPIYVGYRSYHIPPQAFIRDPMEWLRGISKFRASTSGGPNFAYDLCVRKATPETNAGLDLSCWQVAFNGAEPVRAGTLDRFQKALAPYGFSSSAWLPCYGMAEATLFISGGRRPSPVFKQHEGKTHVSCGRSWDDCEVLVVDPNTRRPLADGVTGELWLTGSNIAQGYWNQPEETSLYFQAQLEQGGSTYLRTGDLGFVDQGEVYVTGRLKDLIILRGRNLYPQDLEQVAQEAHSALRFDGGAAFVQEADNGEALVLVQEVERSQIRGLDVIQVFAAIREAHWDTFQIQVDELVLVKPGSIPTTTSGKVRRRACQEVLTAGKLPVIARERRETLTETLPEAGVAGSPPRQRLDKDFKRLQETDRYPFLLEYLRRQIGWCLKLPVTEVPPDMALDRLGLDSVTSVEVMNRIERDFGLRLGADFLYRSPSLQELAVGIMAHLQQQSPPMVEQVVLKLADEVKLPEDWSPADEIADCWPPRQILLTGATGYLGAYLLAELLARTDCEIYCLVRAENDEAAFARLRRNAEYYGLSTELPAERIRPLVGDIALPCLGLDEALYRRLTLQMDAVLSAGAHVDFTLPYSELRASNVFGTMEMLRFAAAGRRKPLHFVSTLGLLMSNTRSDNRPAIESWPPDCEGESLVNGYEQSKWVAEHILNLAADRGMPIAVYRPGLLTGDSISGRFVNTDQFIARFLKSSIQLGCIPELDNSIEMLPVDFSAQVIVAGLQNPSSLGKAFHIRHPEPLVIAEVVEVLRAKGYAMDIVPYAKWQQRVLAAIDDDCGNALSPFRNMIAEMDRRQAEFPPVDDSNCRAICAQAGIGFHSSTTLLESYLLYFESSGFL
jgi:thioester reductase-like protein